MSYEDVKGKNKVQLLKDVCGGSDPGSIIFQQLRQAILVESTRDIEAAVNELRLSNERIATSNESLGRKLFWLNVVLAIATVVAASATCIQAWSAIQTNSQTLFTK